MDFLVYALIFVVGTPIFALGFMLITLFLGLFWEAFRMEGEGSLIQAYKQFLIVAAIYVVLAMIGIRGLMGLAVMAVAYKYVFGAGWLQALVIGILGGLLAWAIFIGILLSLAVLGVGLEGLMGSAG